jgi:hypothetical protein
MRMTDSQTNSKNGKVLILTAKEFLVAKLNDKIVEIVKVAETVQFSNEKNWILISHEVNKRLSMRWLKVDEVKFDWVRRFSF